MADRKLDKGEKDALLEKINRSPMPSLERVHHPYIGEDEISGPGRWPKVTPEQAERFRREYERDQRYLAGLNLPPDPKSFVYITNIAGE